VYELAANQTIAAFSHPASGEGSAANVAANMATTEEVTATAKNAATAKVAAAKALAWKGSDHATRHPAHC
jgi:hypothetical protein